MEIKDDFFEILLRLELECPICGKISKIDSSTLKKNREGVYTCSCGYHIFYFDLSNDLEFIKESI